MTEHQESLRGLGKCLQIHDSGLKLLHAKSTELLSACDKLRSEPAKVLIQELKSILKGLRDSREEYTKSFNVVAKSRGNMIQVMKQKPASDQKPGVVEAGTQSPCWWNVYEKTPEQPVSSNKTAKRKTKAQGT